MATKPDILQMTDTLLKHIREKSLDAEWLMRIMKCREDFAQLYEDEKSVVDDAQRDFRQTKYRFNRFSRRMTSTASIPNYNLTSELSLNARGILWTLEGFSTTQYIQVSTKQLMEMTGSPKRAVTKAMKEILDHGILFIEVPRTNKTAPIYRWSPLMIQTGKPSEWNKEPDALIKNETTLADDEEPQTSVGRLAQARLMNEKPRFVPGRAQKKMPDGTSITFTVIVSNATDGDGNPEI